MSVLLELAKRCEAQAIGEWAEIAELFEDAFRECFPKPERIWVTDNRGEWTEEYSEWQAQQCGFYELVEVGAFLDAALALVDPDVFFHVSRFSPGEGPANAHVYPNRCLGDDYEADAATPALALCAAALKMRAASVDTHAQRGDAKQAPSLTSGAVPHEDEADAPTPPSNQGSVSK